jgi:hypothetical protein
MPGARPRGFRLGDRGELLAGSILSSIAFTVPVPRQEDVGHDLLCTISEPDGQLLRAGPFFTVQVKSDTGAPVFEKPHEIEWIRSQENPFFICIANRDDLAIELFSTWNMLNGILYRKTGRIELVPGDPDADYEPVTTLEDRSNQLVPLGRPVIRMSMQDAMNEERAHTLGAILTQWVAIDRENIVNRRAGMHWVVGPTNHETNSPPRECQEWRIEFFWNAKNLSRCVLNFGRSATELRLTLRKAFGNTEAESWGDTRTSVLDEALRAYSEQLDPLAKDSLRKHIGLDL